VNAPYTYEWDYDMATISVLSTSSVSITTIDNGTFQVTVTDNTGCSSVLGNTLNNALVLSGSNIAPNTSGDSATPNGSIDLTIMGGVSPYELEWSNGLNTNETSIYNLASGWYFVNITDQDNNSITDWFWIPDASNTGGVRGKQATIASNMPAMYVYPSIANADASLCLDIPTSTSAKILLFNSSGQIITQLYEGYFESAGKYAFSVPIEQLANGIYFVHLQTQNGGQTQQKFIVVK
ncbi:MAG: T9SS type A sorting domain-containing protein, partial [Chitinophagales bacterium]